MIDAPLSLIDLLVPAIPNGRLCAGEARDVLRNPRPEGPGRGDPTDALCTANRHRPKGRFGMSKVGRA